MLRATVLRLAHMFPFLLEQQPGHFLINVHAKPGARASAFAGPLTPLTTELDLRIAAPPVEGQANAELVRFLDEVVEQGLRELQTDPATYLEDTSFSLVVAAEVAAATSAAAAATSATQLTSSSGNARKRGKGKEGVSGDSGSQNKKAGGAKADPSGKAKGSASATLPERVEVTLVRGGTSREKTVLALFPGTRAQLIAILEKAAQT